MDTHGDPEAEYELQEAWLVGPTSRSIFRFMHAGQMSSEA